MSYHARNRLALGGTTDDVVTAAQAAINIVQDPCLGQVANLVMKLHSLEQPSSPKPGSTSSVPGVGLCSAVKPLQAVVYVKQNMWVLPVAGIGIVGALVGLGYLLGKGRK